jgi:hypothetical protein
MILFVINKTSNNINSAEIAPEDSMRWFPDLTPLLGYLNVSSTGWSRYVTRRRAAVNGLAWRDNSVKEMVKTVHSS